MSTCNTNRGRERVAYEESGIGVSQCAFPKAVHAMGIAGEVFKNYEAEYAELK